MPRGGSRILDVRTEDLAGRVEIVRSVPTVDRCHRGSCGLRQPRAGDGDRPALAGRPLRRRHRGARAHARRRRRDVNVVVADIDAILRRLAPKVLADLIRRNTQFEASEDAVQEALLAASRQWPEHGLPDDPRAWLTTVAQRRFTDHVRSERARRNVRVSGSVEPGSRPRARAGRRPDRDGTPRRPAGVACRPRSRRDAGTAGPERPGRRRWRPVAG
jgi:hypothetical protein